MFIIKQTRQVRISTQSKATGCKTPDTLSSITTLVESAAMKINNKKLSPLQEENRNAMKQ